jgi:hypothetical protein
LAIVLSVLLSFGHCVVYSSVFWPLCCLFFCLLAIVLSILLRYTYVSDIPFDIFKLFFCLYVQWTFSYRPTIKKSLIHKIDTNMKLSQILF